MLSAHEGPIGSVSFSPFQVVLASSSWDKTLRLWDVFERKGAIEKLVHTSDGRYACNWKLKFHGWAADRYSWALGHNYWQYGKLGFVPIIRA